MEHSQIRMHAREWAKNRRFVAAVDAYTQNFGNVEDCLQRTFRHSPFIPAGFSIPEFFLVIDATADLIAGGDIEDLEAIRREHAEFYILPERFRD